MVEKWNFFNFIVQKNFRDQHGPSCGHVVMWSITAERVLTPFVPVGGGLDSLYQVRLLSALRSGTSTVPVLLTVYSYQPGDPARIHPFLTDILKERRTSSESDVDLGAAALHLAIRCASCKSELAM